jgi:hypothetical protein
MQCHECGLISLTESANQQRPIGRSYALDADSERALRAPFVRAGATQRVLQVLVGDHQSAGLHAECGLELTTITLPMDESRLTVLAPASFDGVFVNAAVEQVADPLELLRYLRTLVRSGGTLVVVVGSAHELRLFSDESRLPRSAYTVAPLTHLVLSAGFQPNASGLVFRSPTAEVLDDRLAGEVPLGWAHKALDAAGRDTQVSSGLLSIQATAAESSRGPRLSIIMPVFNEAATFRETFDQVYALKLAGVEKEIIVVESKSTDGTRELVKAVEHLEGVCVLYEEKPKGKGHAVRAGMHLATGDILLIQDADSEYDVADYDILLEPLLRLSHTFVLGSRHLGNRSWKIRQFTDNKGLSLVMNVAHEFFTELANNLYQSDIRDPATMYKVFRRECVEGMDLTRDRFDFDWELVCKLVRRGHIPLEVPINYRARSYDEGKKVRFFRDPLTWLTTIVRSRFEPMVR